MFCSVLLLTEITTVPDTMTPTTPRVEPTTPAMRPGMLPFQLYSQYSCRFWHHCSAHVSTATTILPFLLLLLLKKHKQQCFLTCLQICNQSHVAKRTDGLHTHFPHSYICRFAVSSHACISEPVSHPHTLTHTLTLLRSNSWCHCAPWGLWALKSVRFRSLTGSSVWAKISSHSQRILPLYTHTHTLGIWFHSYRSVPVRQVASLGSVQFRQVLLVLNWIQWL